MFLVEILDLLQTAERDHPEHPLPVGFNQEFLDESRGARYEGRIQMTVHRRNVIPHQAVGFSDFPCLLDEVYLAVP